MKVTGKGAGKAFQYEPGQHCVQRIPPTETKGRKQTSMVSVAILPIRETLSEVIPESDLKVDAVNLGGKGGQHQNKSMSGCRITHLPTKQVVTINGREYHKNEREARKILTARIADAKQAENDAEYAAKRRAQMGDGGRSGKIRTYNFMESRAVDHRFGTKTGNIKAVMKGAFEKLFPEKEE